MYFDGGDLALYLLLYVIAPVLGEAERTRSALSGFIIHKGALLLGMQLSMLSSSSSANSYFRLSAILICSV